MVTAYRRLWDGLLPDPAEFQRAFETIQPLYYHDKTRAPTTCGARVRSRDPARADPGLRDIRRAPPLSRIRVPTFLAVGRHDWICPVEETLEIARLVPHAEVHIFEHSGHSPQVEEPDALFSRLRAFLDRV